MHTIETAKEHLIEALDSLDKSKMSLNDLMMYAQVLKIGLQQCDGTGAGRSCAHIECSRRYIGAERNKGGG